ncbi:UDP-N-acetylmuramate dehydrogenase [Zongyangia hominis]|uniref:UDP-N-acetylenolpyruvoylglucosamine reductase n=1 Tax=Zongyangia hominis TaxID=2763677 RepID=A0A926ECC4_9FIRM|nr:UDP-N-acetylmuramate dehydrogenase [Zongyangia hominis]MBC8569526.1 UDP-N-acetylmuramate dehydrogenase [Zongyangia hominis]
MVDTFFLRALSGMDCEAIPAAPLSRYTTFHIGGPADVLIKPRSAEALAQVLRLCQETGTSKLILGKGSNLLVSDEGFAGAAICLDRPEGEIRLIGDDLIECDAGVSLKRLCTFAREQGLSGLEFAYGIPGSVGGAVYMNAGAYGGEMSDVLQSARHLDSEGREGCFAGEELKLSYRHSAYTDTDLCILSARFQLTPGDKGEIGAKMDDFLARRKSKQPLEYPSAGSTFKRPAGNYASALIDQCGLKGFRVGGAQVSEKHAGFVINTGGATCRDVKALIAKIQEKVKEQTGYCLECEVKMIEKG